MSRLLWRSLWLAPAVLGFAALNATAQEAPAQEAKQPVSASGDTSTIEKVITYGENTGPNRVGQVTSVSQLSDVRPTDWAFQALQSLVERYGCIVGYPDRTYRGNRALTRYEFAAGLNACIDRVNELIAAATADLVKKEDLDTLRRLQDEFRAELDELRGRVDALDARTTTLERQQFSTTAKLNAEVILAYANAFGDERALTSDQQRQIDFATTDAAREALRTQFLGTRRDVQDNGIVADRVRLNIDASFSGRDRLRTTLQARNITQFSGAVTGTNMTRLGFDGVSGTGNAFELRRLEYRFPLGDLTTVFLGGGTNDGLEFNDALPTLSPVESSGAGAISRFGRFNPIYRASTGTGLIVNQRLGREATFGNAFTLSLGYLVPTADAQDPGPDRGIFNGSYAAIAQLAYAPTPQIGIGLTYARLYSNTGAGISGGTGSGFANNPFNSAGTPDAAGNVPTTANLFGVQANIRLSRAFSLFGWGGYTKAEAQRTVAAGNQGSIANPNIQEGDEATIWNWAVGVALPDLFKEGNLAGIIFGQPPKVTQNDYSPANTVGFANRRRDRDTSYHLEGFYRFRLNDNIAVTPGLLVIFNPEHNDDNDTEFVGTLRTTFTF
ncbi:carbohydrate porin [Leptolyngbya sp. FACHB-36]|uniref:iron uptake porin n=1 Tax=Leptolyngbya sp. FACHB-36 TaxID=2692808 RepID=UPI001680F420|nr:iron uptake porin [Leptolyngbya sp. FACHB-36]MBD2021080.1 carbohydrate porin [Leptolyngbya sp. FACHB-36]